MRVYCISGGYGLGLCCTGVGRQVATFICRDDACGFRIFAEEDSVGPSLRSHVVGRPLRRRCLVVPLDKYPTRKLGRFVLQHDEYARARQCRIRLTEYLV